MADHPGAADVEIVAVDATSWHVFEDLFGPDGVEGGCWCSYFLLPASEWRRGDVLGRKAFVRSRVDAGEPYGLVARVDGVPAAWVAVAPRRSYRRLDRSVIARVEPGRDVSGTWSVVCFYARRGARGQGLSRLLLDEAVAYARGNGAEVIEGYPVDTDLGRVAAAERFYGRLDTFLAAGFDLVERRGTRRALVRLTL